jgi:hypothetical protein
MIRILWTIVLCSFLSACSMFQNNTNENRLAVCKELKRRIIFNGATSNDTKAVQQRAELNTLNQDYRDERCP